MLANNHLIHRFRCDRFSYAIVNDAYAVGLASGGKDRVGGAFLGRLLLTVDHND